MSTTVRRRLITTVGPDPARALIGSSGYVGDRSNLGIVLPTTPSTAPNNRYLCRLLGLELGPGVICRIIGIRQFVSIAAKSPIFLSEGSDTDHKVLFEKEVTSPVWSFPNGNISWHLRRVNPNQYQTPTDSQLPAPGTSTNILGIDSAILYDPQPGMSPYVAPNAGIPWGDDIAGLGTFRDLKFPWRDSPDLSGVDAVVNGPCIVQFMASVYQTNPEQLFVPKISMCDLGAICVSCEDQFLYGMQQVLSTNNEDNPIAVYYHRIAAELDVEIIYPDFALPPGLPGTKPREVKPLLQGDEQSTEKDGESR